MLEAGALGLLGEPPFVSFEPLCLCAALTRLHANPRVEFAAPPGLFLGPPAERRGRRKLRQEPPEFRRGRLDAFRAPPDDCLGTLDAFARRLRDLVEPPSVRSERRLSHSREALRNRWDAWSSSSSSLPSPRAARTLRCAALPARRAARRIRRASPPAPRAAPFLNHSRSPRVSSRSAKARSVPANSFSRSTRTESGPTRFSGRPARSSRLPGHSRRRSRSSPGVAAASGLSREKTGRLAARSKRCSPRIERRLLHVKRGAYLTTKDTMSLQSCSPVGVSG
jgi:hypothetical protein